jgi:hypothetical protein
MAIFGIGATYKGEDVSQQFIAAGAACVGYKEDHTPPRSCALTPTSHW